MIQIFLKNEKGIVAALIALLLPVMLGMIALVIDGGNLYIRHSELHFLAQSASTSGLLEFSKSLETKAEGNKTVLCTVVPPASVPSICSSNNLFDFLSDTEILTLFSDLSVVNNVKENVKDFAKIYDTQTKIKNENIEVFFGKDFHLGDKKIELQVKLEETPDRFFSSILREEASIKIVAVSSLPLE